MAAWLIIMRCGLDEWIYWKHLLQSLAITIDYNISQLIFSRTLLPWLPSTCSSFVLILVLRLTWFESVPLSRRILRKNIHFPAIDVCEPDRKYIFYCQECVFIGPLLINGSTCHNIFMLYMHVYLSMAIQSFCGTLAAFSVSWYYTQLIGLLGRGISPSQGRYLHIE
jgi:hypothetical protein